MGEINVRSTTQRIVVESPTSVTVIPAGPVGPPGVQGVQGIPGEDAQTSVGTVMAAHVNSESPHPVYDDMQDLTTLLENGLY